MSFYCKASKRYWLDTQKVWIPIQDFKAMLCEMHVSKINVSKSTDMFIDLLREEAEINVPVVPVEKEGEVELVEDTPLMKKLFSMLLGPDEETMEKTARKIVNWSETQKNAEPCANPTGSGVRFKPPTTTPAEKVRTLLEPLQVSGKFVPFLLLVSLLKQKQTKTLDLYYVFVECLRFLTFKFAFLQGKTFHRFNTLTWFVLYLYFAWLFFWFSICFNSPRFMQGSARF